MIAVDTIDTDGSVELLLPLSQVECDTSHGQTWVTYTPLYATERCRDKNVRATPNQDACSAHVSLSHSHTRARANAHTTHAYIHAHTQNKNTNIHTSGPRYLSRYIDTLLAGRSGDRIPVRTRFTVSVQTGPGVYPASCTKGKWSFSRG
jgi:hypothetical protein